MNMLLRAVSLLLCLVLVACQGNDNGPTFPTSTPRESPTGTDTLIIGLVGTTSGPGSWRGDNAFRGADLGVHILNRRSSEDRVVELRTLDDGGDPERAAALVEELASSERTLGVVYAGPPEALPRAEDALARAGIPALLVFGDLYGARRLTPHVFQVSPSLVWEARTIARYLVRDRRYRTIGLLATDSVTGRVARRALQDALRTLGRRLAVSATFAEESDPEAALALLKRRRVEAVVLEAPPPAGAATLARLKETGSVYRSTARARIATAPTRRRARAHARSWRPQIVGFDSLVTTLPERLAWPGLAGSDSYARGAHYLPIPSLEDFHRAYVGWWETEPLAWERRAFEAVQLIGWAATQAADDEEDLAAVLEELEGERFGGLDVTFGPDDHTAVDQTQVGLWVVPRPGAASHARDLPENLPWVPLGRGFSIDGETTDFAARDWRFLFPGSPRRNGPAPKLRRALYGVTSPRSDPVH